MAVILLSQVPRTAEEWATWHFNHQAHHRDILSKVQQIYSVHFPEYVLDPVNEADMGVYTYQHQQMHNNQDPLLGLPQYDLTQVDWRDTASVEAWVQQNFSLHQSEALILGID